MPLRELPTEQDAAVALLRTERLRKRTADRSRQRLGTVVAVLAVAAVVAILLPGLGAGGRCSPWRPDIESLFGRRAGLVLPAAALVLVLAARAVDADHPWAVGLRRWTAAVCVGYPLLVPVALAQQGGRRDECGWTGTSWAALAIGVALAVVAIRWASVSTPSPALTGSRSGQADGGTALNQPELRAVFSTLSGELGPRRQPRRGLHLAIGALAIVLALSLLGPWRELAVPQRLLGDLPHVYPGATAWSLPGAGRLSWLLVLAAAATLASVAVPRAAAAAGPLAAATGALAVAGWLVVVPHLPPTATGGTGYRIAPAGWLALAAGVALCGCGLLAVAARARPSGRRLRAAGVTAAAAVAGAVLAALVADAPSYGAVRLPSGAVFEVRSEVLTDAAGLRVEVADNPDWDTSEQQSPLVSALDGSSGHWFLGNLPEYRKTERIDTATVFAWRDGIATPLTTVRYAQVQLVGVVDDRMLAFAKGRRVSGGPERWAVVSIPLAMPYADVSLTSGTEAGRPWVSSGVTVLAHGTADQVEVAPAGSGAIAVSATSRDTRSGLSWLVPAEVVRAGTPWTPDVVRTPAEAGASRLRVAPDGTVAWVRNGQVMTVRAAGRPRALSATTAACRRQRVAADAPNLAYDDRGNLWLTARGRLDVITADGVRRTAPLGHVRVREIQPGPDGSLMVASGDRIPGRRVTSVRRIDDASRAATSYQPAAMSETPCEHDAVPPTTTRFTAEAIGQVEVVDPPSRAGDPRDVFSGVHELVAYGGGIRRMRPAGTAPATDGQGGLWWLRLPPRSAELISTGTVRAVHVRADGSVASTDATVTLRRVSGTGRATALGDRYAYLARTLVGTTGAAYGYLDVAGRTARQLAIADPVGWASTSGRSVAWAATGRAPELVVPVDTSLARVNPDGSTTRLIGGRPDREQVPIAAAIARGLGRDHYSIKGDWFTGPDRAVWGYDGRYLYRLDSTGRVTVLGGQDQGVPVAANRVTVIGRALFFEVGLEVVKLTPQGMPR